MRMRKRRNLDKRMEECSSIWVKDAYIHKGNWNKVFNNDNSIHVEIGCGKGKFIVEMAKKYPNVNFIAFEKISNVIVLAMEMAKKENLSNLLFVNMDAKSLLDIFSEDEIDLIYLNFSDPWPKARSEKHRLTYIDFLNMYKKIIKKGGKIIIKTDNKGFFEYSLNSFINANLKFESITLDLHALNDEFNVLTEYEEKFTSMNAPIYRAVVLI